MPGKLISVIAPFTSTFAQKMDHTVGTGNWPPNAPQAKRRLSSGTLTLLLTNTRAHW